jgi:hypothetical protein
MSRAAWLYALVFAFGLVLAPITVLAQNPPPPIDEARDAKGNPILGGWLETRFQQMVQSCTQSADRLKVEKKGLFGDDVKEVSAIPQIVSRELGLQSAQSILIQADGNVIREFGYVYTTDEIAADQHKYASYLNIDYSHDATQLTEPGISGIIYSNSCASVMSAAIQASGGYSLPVASVKAGLSADYDQSSSYDLDLVTGMFDSPILLMYYGSVPNIKPSQSKLYADMLFWKWYSEHTDRVSADNWILQEFKGLALYKTGGFKQQTKYGFNVQANVASPFVTANGMADAQFDNRTQVTVNSFQTAALFDVNGDLHRIWFKVPTIADLTSTISSEASASLDVDNSKVNLIDRSPKSHLEDIVGLPTIFCDASLWRVEGSTVSIKSATESTKNSQTACVFTVEYLPSDDDLKNGVELSYSFVNSIDGGAGKKYDIKIPAAHVALTGTDVPRLLFAGGSRLWTATNAGAGAATLSWQLVYQLFDDDLIAKESDIDLSNVTLTCPSGVDAQPILVPTTSSGSPSKKLNVAVTAPFQAAPPDSTTTKYDQCKLGGKVAYTLTGAAKNPVTKLFPDTVIYYPLHSTNAVVNPGTPPVGAIAAVSKPLPVGAQPQ